MEIVQKLLEMQLLEILFTTDGKEYVTPSHLGTEIKDELYMCGGRVSLVQLASNLSIDYSHVEAAAQGVAGGDTHLVLGQLVSADYMEELCRQELQAEDPQKTTGSLQDHSQTCQTASHIIRSPKGPYSSKHTKA